MATSNFTVSAAGGFVAPNGQKWTMRGLNAGVQDALQGFAKVQTDYPGLTAIRLNCDPSNDSAASIAQVVQEYTAAGVVVEIEDHSGNGDNVAWYQQMATAYKGNPLVFLETPNEPTADAATTAQNQIGIINAVRAAGFTGLIGVQPNGGWDYANVSTVTAAVGTAGLFMTPHIYYNGTDPNGAANYVQGDIQGAQSLGLFASIDEFGNAIDGYTLDPYGNSVITSVVAANEAGQAGAVFWAMDNDNHPDGTDSAFLTRDGSQLTPIGQNLQPWLSQPTTPTGGGTTPPVTPPVPPAPVTTGTGSDTLVLGISEDAYQGDAQFTVSVDGKQLGGTFTTTASHASGVSQSFTFKGGWAPGAHAVAVNFLNDAWGGSVATDRNLYVNGITYDGTATGQSAALMGTGPQSFSVTDSTAIPSTTPPATPSPDGTKITTAAASPIIDQAGNKWTLVQSASNGLQIAVNGTVDITTTNVVLLETLGGNIVQENTAGNWYSEPGPGSAWAQIAAPAPVIPPVTPPAATPVITGIGSDTLVFGISEDAYQGNAQFTVSVDGKQLAGTFAATASHATGASQNFTFKGDWAPGAHAVAVNFLNDAYGGTAATDRNLYVNAVTYDGKATGQTAALMGGGPQSFSVTDTTAIPAAAIGIGADTLVIGVSEDAYLGDAQFTVSVDGKQLGGTFTTMASHAAAASQNFTFKGDFGPGAHAVAVNFLNDAWGGTAATDRNLYVNAITYNGAATAQSATLGVTGPQAFSVTGGTAPSVSETGDHGALAKTLSQTGSYTVGGDTFVLTTGHAASVTLGTGTSQIKFIGASSATLTGGSGQATVTADAGSNKFVAGTGTLDVTGGGGKDAYVFHANGGLLKLEDFSIAKGDTLTVDKALQGTMQQTSDGQGAFHGA